MANDPPDPGDARAAVEAIFDAAARLPASDRAAYLDEACGDDAGLRRRAEALLDADAAAGAFLTVPHDAPGDDPLIGTEIGGCRVTSILGVGGMGTVYLAEQLQPSRPVALKVMNPGAASPSALRRFEFEAHALGLMRHPNVAHVYGAGTHDFGAGGVPYFVMEYIAGARTIVEHASETGLSLRQRLSLLATVCDAVHHGHQKGVIHRDLKPSNILVTEDPGSGPRQARVKLLDFGIAKVVRDRKSVV